MTGSIKIFCPIHEASFDVPAGPKVLCEITGHVMSTGFPSAECWEFCCNCETFSPSGLGKGETARNTCFSCQNEIAKRFVCDSCGTYIFECSSRSRGRQFSLEKAGVGPFCPGCGNAPAGDKLERHECKEIDVAFASNLRKCPFCLEDILPAPQKVVTTDMLGSTICPQCRSRIGEGSVFCGKCSHRLRADVPVENPGTDVIRPQAIGSLCPNCASLLPDDSSFCGECGQAVIEARLPPPPPPPPPSRRRRTEPSEAPIDSTIKLESAKATNGLSVAAIVGSICVGLVVLFTIMFAAKSTVVTNNSNGTDSRGRNTNSNANVRKDATNDYFTGLSEGVERSFSGTYVQSGMSVTLSLTRKGANLEGMAETDGSWDKLTGIIDSAGNFDLEGWEGGTDFTGRYVGQFVSNSEISGSWTLPDGTKERRFRVYLQ